MENIKDTLKKVKIFLSKRPEVVVCYLFGSFATGGEVKGSDIDLGIFLNPDFKYDIFYLSDFQNSIESLANAKMQIVIINDKSPLLKYKVISPRKIIYCRDDNLRAEFEVRTMKNYLEMRPYIEESFKSVVEKASYAGHR